MRPYDELFCNVCIRILFFLCLVVHVSEMFYGKLICGYVVDSQSRIFDFFSFGFLVPLNWIALIFHLIACIFKTTQCQRVFIIKPIYSHVIQLNQIFLYFFHPSIYFSEQITNKDDKKRE